MNNSEIIWDKVVTNIREPESSKKIWSTNIDNKLALVIIEPRKHKWLKGVLYNFSHVYGGRNDTSLYIFHGNENKDFILDIVNGWNGIHLVNMNVSNLTIYEYNHLITSLNFWNIIKSEYALIFQTDTLLRKEISPEFFKYDYVGAPWKKTYNSSNCKLVGNGGLSLRNIKIMKYICSLKPNKDISLNEDVYYSERLLESFLPSVEEASKFSVESIFYNDPCGMHKAYDFFDENKITSLLKNIPGIIINY